MRGRWFLLPIVIVATLTIAACSAKPDDLSEPVAEPDEWVVVMFEDARAMSRLLDVELAADEALQDAGAGFIDGNEVGAGTYDLYFVGQDNEEMWRILKPVFDSAPVDWSRVEAS